MKVLHVSPSFYPATRGGGPIAALHELCNGLARTAGIELRVLTTDAADRALRKRLPLTARRPLYPAGYEVVFHRRLLPGDTAPGLLLHLPAAIRWAEVVHLTATYSFPTLPTLFLCRLLGRPLVWSPRGALMRWEGSRRRAAKWLWERVCDPLLDPRRSVLHATTEEEAAASACRIRTARPVVIPNGIRAPDALSERTWRPDGCLRLLYMGRLDPIKGLENLLDTMAHLDGRARLAVYGAGDPDYTASLHDRASRLGPRVTFHGHVEGEAKTRAFAEADLCVLPSFTENFGLVVAEALAHGVPVVASDRTPWRALDARGCGACVANDPESLARAIGSLCDRDLPAMGERGRAWMREDFGWDKIAARMAELYRSLL